MRINITGNAASGKTTLAAQLADDAPGLPEPCPDIAIVPRLLELIYRFPANAGAQIRREARREPHRFRIESHSVQVAAVLRGLQELVYRK